MLIDKTLLDELTKKVKVNPRLRMNYDLLDSADDESQRMLNAIERGPCSSCTDGTISHLPELGEWYDYHRGQEYEV